MLVKIVMMLFTCFDAKTLHFYLNFVQAGTRSKGIYGAFFYTRRRKLVVGMFMKQHKTGHQSQVLLKA